MSSTRAPSPPEVPRLRLSVLGVDGATSHLTVDAAVSPDRLLEALAVGPASLRRLAGDPLRPDLALAEQEVASGSCLVLEPRDTDAAPTGEREVVASAAPAGSRLTVVLAALGCFVVAALVVAVEVVSALDRPAVGAAGVTAGTGLVVALVVAVLASGAAAWTGRGAHLTGPVRIVLPPLAGAVVGFAAVQPGAGELLLAITAAAVTTASVAAFLRADRRVGQGSVAEAALLVECVLGAVTAAATGTALLTDVPLAACAALVAGVALPVLRLLPGAIVRVPERLLMDVDTVAVTAWSPPPHAERMGRAPVVPATVTTRIRRDRRLLDAAVVGLVGAAVSCLVVALVDLLTDASVPVEEEICGIALAVGVAGGLALAARAVRGRVAKVALVSGAVAVACLLAVAVLVDVAGPGDDVGAAGGTPRLVVALSAAAVGLLVAGLALLWGTGRRSLRWERIGDLLEGATVVLTPALALVAAGGWAWMRSLVS